MSLFPSLFAIITVFFTIIVIVMEREYVVYFVLLLVLFYLVTTDGRAGFFTSTTYVKTETLRVRNVVDATRFWVHGCEPGRVSDGSRLALCQTLSIECPSSIFFWPVYFVISFLFVVFVCLLLLLLLLSSH